MTSSLGRSPIRGPHDNYGFSTKAVIAEWLDERLSILTQGEIGYFAWFALRPNPIDNIDSSNPVLIFVDIDTAIQRNDYSHKKVDDLRTAMMAQIYSLLPHDHPDVKSLIRAVSKAELEEFRPLLWVIDLAELPDSSYKGAGSGEFETTGFTLPRSCIREALG